MMSDVHRYWARTLLKVERALEVWELGAWVEILAHTNLYLASICVNKALRVSSGVSPFSTIRLKKIPGIIRRPLPDQCLKVACILKPLKSFSHGFVSRVAVNNVKPSKQTVVNTRGNPNTIKHFLNSTLTFIILIGWNLSHNLKEYLIYSIGSEHKFTL